MKLQLTAAWTALALFGLSPCRRHRVTRRHLPRVAIDPSRGVLAPANLATQNGRLVFGILNALPTSAMSLDAWLALRCDAIRHLERDSLQARVDGGRVNAAPRARAIVNRGPVDSTGGEGNIDAGRVSAILRSRWAPIRDCYESLLNRGPRSDGFVEVIFSIGPDGRVYDAHLSARSAREPGACVLDQVTTLQPPRPTGGSVEFTFTYTFCAPE